MIPSNFLVNFITKIFIPGIYNVLKVRLAIFTSIVLIYTLFKFYLEDIKRELRFLLDNRYTVLFFTVNAFC